MYCANELASSSAREYVPGRVNAKQSVARWSLPGSKKSLYVHVGPYIGIDIYYIYGRADVDFLGLFLFVLVLTTCNDVFLAVRIVVRCL